MKKEVLEDFPRIRQETEQALQLSEQLLRDISGNIGGWVIQKYIRAGNEPEYHIYARSEQFDVDRQPLMVSQSSKNRSPLERCSTMEFVAQSPLLVKQLRKTISSLLAIVVKLEDELEVRNDELQYMYNQVSVLLSEAME